MELLPLALLFPVLRIFIASWRSHKLMAYGYAINEVKMSQQLKLSI